MDRSTAATADAPDVGASGTRGSRPDRADGLDLAALVHEHSGLVWRYAMGLLGDPEEAEEVTQDTFLRVHRSLDTFRGEAALSTWIVAICRNLCLDRLRRRRLAVVPLDDAGAVGQVGDSPSYDTGDPAERVALREVLRAGMARLSHEEREAFHLVDVLGFSGTEAAAIVDVPPTTLRSRLARARRELVAHVLQEGAR